MMQLAKVAHGTQWRAYCPVCGVGLNWYTDPSGTAAAQRFTDHHNQRHNQETLPPRRWLVG